MKKDIGHTGGLRRIEITSEDRKRWENEDTEPTKKFKQALQNWKNTPKTTNISKVRTDRVDDTNEQNNFSIKSLFIVVIMGFFIYSTYANLEKLNDFSFGFVKAGYTLLLIGLFLFFKFIIKAHKTIRN